MTQSPSNNPLTEAEQAIRELLAALVRTKQFLGYQYASWCVRAPSIEANIALAGMAQEEVGHVIAVGGLLDEDSPQATPDKDTLITWDFWSKAGTRDAAPSAIDEWPRMIVTCLARDAAATAALDALKDAADTRLSSRAKKMLQEEQFHLMFAVETARTFAGFLPDARRRLAEDYQHAVADSEAEYGFAKTLSRLSALGVLPSGAAEARVQYLKGVTQRLNDAWS